MPVVGNYDDHDFGPNDYFGLGSSALLDSADVMRSKASFDRRVAARAFKALWPARYAEWDGDAGIEHVVRASPLADVVVTDTRYYASIPNKQRFEAATIAHIGALCASPKPVLVLVSASQATVPTSEASWSMTSSAQLTHLTATLNSTGCRTKAILLRRPQN